MKILWIVNMVLPRLANHLGISGGLSGTWMYDASERLAKEEDVELAIACVHGAEYKKIKLDDTIFYCLPGTGRDMMFYNKKFEGIWKNIYDDFKPDIVHLHGTEYTHGLAFMRACPNAKTVISLQGVINRIKDVDLTDLNFWQCLRYRTKREWLRFNGMWEMHLWHKQTAKTEREMLSKTDDIVCVDSWHRAQAKRLNPNANVHIIDYNLRKSFYDSEKWNIDKINRHQISTNPGGTPLKGLANLCRAIALVKDTYPDVKVLVPGMTERNGELAPTSGYAKYLRNLIRKLGVKENIKFLGKQTEEEMLNNMITSHVQVVPSAIEGPSLVLREGMHLGVPTIASFRGGMADFVDDKVNGFLYDYNEVSYLAMRITDIFSDDELAKRLSKNAIEKTAIAHDREKNLKSYKDTYYKVLSK